MPDASTPTIVTPPAADSASPSAGAPNAQPPAAQPPKVPEKYDLKLPDGSLLEASHIERISSFAKEKGLSNEMAQSLLEREHGAVSSYAEAQKQNYNKTVDSWAKLVEADSEIGGEGYKKNVELASRVIKRFGSESLVKALNETGYGNHPELVRAFTRIGKAMTEDQLVMPGTQPPAKPSMEDRFYGSKTQ